MNVKDNMLDNFRSKILDSDLAVLYKEKLIGEVKRLFSLFEY